MAKYEYKVKGVDYAVEIQDIEGNIANVTVNGIPFEVEMKQPVKAGKQKVKLSEERRVKSEIKVKVGDKVNAGDTVVVLEAMKMQNNIDAETSGTIASINVNKGDAVMEGDTLVTIA